MNQIKHRYTGEVLYECEAGLTTRQMLEKATAAGADLRGANFYGANLRGANLYGADLRGANLRGADLRGANFYGANLRGANLYGADLGGADLRGANLYGADFYGANLGGKGKAVGSRPYFSIGPIGSRADTLVLWLTDKGQYVKAGCFFDTLEKFAEAVEKTYCDSDHGKEYRMAILMMEEHAALWTPKEEV